MDEDFGMAWLPGLSQRDQRSEEDPEVMGATEAWEPRSGVLGLWPAGLQDCGDAGAGSAGPALVGVPRDRGGGVVSGELSGLWTQDREGGAVAEQGTV